MTAFDASHTPNMVMSVTTTSSSTLVDSRAPSPLSTLPPPPKIPSQPRGHRRKQNDKPREMTHSPLRNEMNLTSASDGSNRIGVEVPRRVSTFPIPSSNRRLPSSPSICRPLLPDSCNTGSLDPTRPLEEVARTPLRAGSGWKKVVFKGMAFLTLRRCSTDDSHGLVASADAPVKLSDIECSSKHGFLLSYDPAKDIEVRSLDTKLRIPIGRGTTAVDMIAFAANAFPNPADKTAIVVWECLMALGIERPLRRYEKIRTVRKTWGPDHQNWLRVNDSGDQQIVSTLPIKDFRSDSTFLLFHSSSPKKWVERWVTVKANGQIVANNRAGYDPGNLTSLCHLADFDIYTPMRDQAHQRLKLPGKFWVVLKRQGNFDVTTAGGDLQYFSTEDKQLADRFYEFVYRQRSNILLSKDYREH